jgi:hypothetical protein
MVGGAVVSRGCISRATLDGGLSTLGVVRDWVASLVVATGTRKLYNRRGKHTMLDCLGLLPHDIGGVVSRGGLQLSQNSKVPSCVTSPTLSCVTMGGARNTLSRLVRSLGTVRTLPTARKRLRSVFLRYIRLVEKVETARKAIFRVSRVFLRL